MNGYRFKKNCDKKTGWQDRMKNTQKSQKKCWLSRRQGLEKEAGLRRIPLQPAVCSYYNEEKNKMSKNIKKTERIS
jgi:hypothetical protein